MSTHTPTSWRAWAQSFPAKADKDAPYKSPFTIVNKGSATEAAEILLYDVIGRDWWSGEGWAANDFAEKLKEIDPKAKLVIGINSPGGNVDDGLAIFNMLQRRGNVTTRNDGMAASIASVILQAGETRESAESAMVMIHKAWSLFAGNADDSRKFAEVLDKHDQVIAETYARRSGKDVSMFMQKMAEESYFTGKEAVEIGLVDAITAPKKALAAQSSAPKNDASGNVRSIAKPDDSAATISNSQLDELAKGINAFFGQQVISASAVAVADGQLTAAKQNKTKENTVMSENTTPAVATPPADNSAIIDAIKAGFAEIKNTVTANSLPGAAPLTGTAHVKKQITNGDELWDEASKISDLADRTRFVRNEISNRRDLKFKPLNANTLGGTEITRIAQMTLDYLAVQMRPITAFTTDFSAETAMPGKTITTRFVTQPSTADFSSSKAVADVTTTARSITLDKYRGVSLGFTDLERTYTDVQMQELFIKPSVTAIYEHIMSSLFALVLNANYSSSVVSTAANTDADDVADWASVLSTAKCPTTGRSLILPPSYYAALAKDNAIQAAYAYGGSEAIRENNVPRVHGFDVFEYTGTIPTNSENLGAIALHKSALLIASRRVVPPQAGTWYGNVQSATDPESGLTVDVRTHYDGTNQVLQTSLLYGVAVGHGAALYRVKTA